MGRRHVGQVLVTVGLLALLASLFAMGVRSDLRHTRTVRAAAPDLLETSTVRTAVSDEIADAIRRLYGSDPIDEGTLALAVERIVSNGYVVDDFQDALAEAHAGWLYGAPLVVRLDRAVITQASLTGLRDADLQVAQRFPPDGIVDPLPVALPVDQAASSLMDVAALGVLGALVGLALIMVGAVIDPVRHRTLKTLARGLCAGGVLLVVAALVLPLEVVRDTHDVLAVLGVLAGQRVVPLLVLAAVLGFIGLWLHASAERLVTTVTRGVDQARTPRSAKPVRSGAKVSRRAAGRHRSEAIDAFFAEGDPQESAAPVEPDEIVLGADDEVDDSAAHVAGDDLDLDAGDDEPDVPFPTVEPAASSDEREPTPEEERAAALAADRRQALARIDGRQSRYRTHLRR